MHILNVRSPNPRLLNAVLRAADFLPFIVNRLPEDLRLGAGRQSDQQCHCGVFVGCN